MIHGNFSCNFSPFEPRSRQIERIREGREAETRERESQAERVKRRVAQHTERSGADGVEVRRQGVVAFKCKKSSERK